jgi:outer membrane protein insertion porin family
MRILGSTIVSESRLKKIITSRGPFGGIFPYANNKADLNKIDKDVDVLAAYYHNLGFLTATVGRRLEYDRSGKWLSVTFVVNEGPRFRVNEIQILGNNFIKEESLRNRLELKPGDMYDGTLLRRDVGELTYGYGELGFIYAEVEPQTVMRDEDNIVDLVYKISEGDRWRVGEIRVNIDGEPDLMRETTMLNLVDLREGSFINRRLLELNRNRLERSALLETNPQIADPPDIKVIPREDNRNAAMSTNGGSNDY